MEERHEQAAASIGGVFPLRESWRWNDSDRIEAEVKHMETLPSVHHPESGEVSDEV